MSKIEWLHRPNTKAEVSACDGVVSGHETSWSAEAVEPLERGATSAFAAHPWIRLALRATKVVSLTLGLAVFRDGRYDLEILWPVVCSVSVAVMNLLGLEKNSAKQFTGDQPMSIDVATNVGKLVLGTTNKNVAGRRHRASTFPVGVSWTWMDNAHASA